MGMVTIVSAPGVDENMLDLLKEDFDKCLKNKNHPIVTNFEIDIKQIEIESDAEVVVIHN